MVSVRVNSDSNTSGSDKISNMGLSMRLCTPPQDSAHSCGEFHRDTLSEPPQIFKRHHATMLPSMAAQSIRFRDRKYTKKINRGESKGGLACFQKFRQHLRRPIWRRAKPPLGCHHIIINCFSPAGVRFEFRGHN